MRVAICTPVHGDTRAEFTQSLVRMAVYTCFQWRNAGLAEMPELDHLVVWGSNLPGNREALVDRAREWGADWILWADADQTFPPHSLLRLLASGQPVIGCSSARRHDEALPSATIIRDGRHEPCWTTPEKAAGNVAESVSYVGFSLFLMAMSAIDKLDRPIFGSPGSALHTVAEDMIMCQALRKAGYTIFVDHALSWEVGHVVTQKLTLATSLERKAMRDQAAAPSLGA